MDSDMKSTPPENAETKATFRRPSGDVANRNYRRHSPVTGGSSSDENPKRKRSSSPVLSKNDLARVPEPRQRRKDADRELDKNSDRSHYGRSGESYRHSDRYSSRNSCGHSRHDDYRHEKRSDDGRRRYQSSFHSDRESRGVTYSSRAREETEYVRSRDHLRNADKYIDDRYDSSGHRSRDREKESLSIEHHKLKDKESSPDRTGSGRKHTNSISEEKDKERHGRDKDGRDDRRDYYRSSRDYKSDRTLHNDKPRGYRNDSNDPHAQKEKNKREDLEANGDKDKCNRAPVEENEEKFDFGCENQESLAKKPKLPNSNEGNDCVGDALGDEKQSLSSKQDQEIGGKATVGPVHADSAEAANDLNAAKVAAMKAAELVNKNLVGVGFMSTEQKKKLLWGSKKSTTSEESGHRWDTSLFGDRDRQEKFNKLMSLRLPWYLWPIVGCEGQCECGSQSRRSCSSGEAEGTSDGSREAVHCWTSKTRWSYSWIRSLNVCLRSFCYPSTIFYDILLYTQLYTHVGVTAIVTINFCWVEENMLSHGSFHISAEGFYLEAHFLSTLKWAKLLVTIRNPDFGKTPSNSRKLIGSCVQV